MNEQERAEQELVGKNVAFYETFLSAWVENRMETDKQLLTLSSLAIGVLMLFHDRLNSALAFLLWLVAGVLFVFSIVVILLIFYGNSKYIEQIIRDDNFEKRERLEKTLQIKTILAFVFFLMGIVMAFLLVIIKSGFMMVKI